MESARVDVRDIDLDEFVRQALLVHIDWNSPITDQLELGTPILMRMGMSFSTPTETSALSDLLKGFDAYLPPITDPARPDSQAFRLYTDVEEWAFPQIGNCSTETEVPFYASSTIPPIPSLTSLQASWDTYVVGGDAPGDEDTIYILNQYGRIPDAKFYQNSNGYPVVARNADGTRGTSPATVLSTIAVGIGTDPVSAGQTEKPVLFFTGNDGYLRGLLDSAQSINTTWSPDGWIQNAVAVPNNGQVDGRPVLTPPALAPRPDATKETYDQDVTQFVVVGSGTGLYVYQLTFGGAGTSALYQAYEGYEVRTDFAPFVVSTSGGDWVTYFFAKKSGESSLKLWGANLSDKSDPETVMLLLGGDEPSTEIVCPVRSDGGSEETSFMFFGTQDGRVHAIHVGFLDATTSIQDALRVDGEILGLRVVASVDPESAEKIERYRIYANATTNRLHYVEATPSGRNLVFGTPGEPIAPRFSNQKEMFTSLEVLPGNGERPGLIFLTYRDGPLVVLDLELNDVRNSMRVEVWEDVLTAEDRQTFAKWLPIVIPFEFPGTGFLRPVVSRNTQREGEGPRLLIASADGSNRGVYAFDLSVSIEPHSDGETGETEPVSP
jgi:hypothetical protein